MILQIVTAWQLAPMLSFQKMLTLDTPMKPLASRFNSRQIISIATVALRSRGSPRTTRATFLK